jgi:hypothetical protein
MNYVYSEIVSRAVVSRAIVSRAIELLQAGAIDGKTFDQIRHGESCTRSFCIRSALDIAVREFERPLPYPHHRTVTLRKSDYRKAESEIIRQLRDWPADNDKLQRAMRLTHQTILRADSAKQRPALGPPLLFKPWNRQQ